MVESRGHFIYLGMRDRVVMLESGQLQAPYTEIGRVGRRRVYGFVRDIEATDVIKVVANPGDSVGVLCLDEETEVALQGVTEFEGRSISCLNLGMAGTREIEEGLKRVLANHRRVEKPIHYDGHLGED